MDDEISFAVSLFTAACLLAGAVVVAVVTRRAAEGRLARNHWAGIRLPSTMRSDAAWTAGHRAAVAYTDIAAAGGAAGAVVTLAADHDGTYTIAVLGGAGWLTLWLIVGARRAVLAARAVDHVRSGCGD